MFTMFDRFALYPERKLDLFLFSIAAPGLCPCLVCRDMYFLGTRGFCGL